MRWLRPSPASIPASLVLMPVVAVVLGLVALPPAHDTGLVPEVPVDPAEDRRRLHPDDLLVHERAVAFPHLLDHCLIA